MACLRHGVERWSTGPKENPVMTRGNGCRETGKGTTVLSLVAGFRRVSRRCSFALSPAPSRFSVCMADRARSTRNVPLPDISLPPPDAVSGRARNSRREPSARGRGTMPRSRPRRRRGHAASQAGPAAQRCHRRSDRMPSADWRCPLWRLEAWHGSARDAGASVVNLAAGNTTAVQRPFMEAVWQR